MKKSKKGLLIKGLKQATGYFREGVEGRRGRLGSDAALEKDDVYGIDHEWKFKERIRN
ncbi:unnamed protein product [Brassica rapa subsp. narinosa]